MGDVDLIGWIVWTAGFFALVVVTQDLQVFPAVIFSLHRRKGRRLSRPPSEAESIFIESADGKRIEVWRVPAAGDVPPLPYVALVFHGNAGNLENFFGLQLWFHYLGITSYCFDYRGVGHSAGWPTERGLERDSDSFYSYVVGREAVRPEQVIILGFSVGGYPAARIASLHHPKLLLLISAFTDAKRILTETPGMRIFSPFLWWRMRTIDCVRALRATNLVIAHGERDTAVPVQHGRDLLASYRGSGRTDSLFHPTLGHNNLFFCVRDELAEKTLAILGQKGVKAPVES